MVQKHEKNARAPQAGSFRRRFLRQPPRRRRGTTEKTVTGKGKNPGAEIARGWTFAAHEPRTAILSLFALKRCQFCGLQVQNSLSKASARSVFARIPQISLFLPATKASRARDTPR